MASMDERGRLRALALIEGTSLLVLVGVAMPLKYLAHLPQPTRVMGILHGLAFVAYGAALADAYGARLLTARQVALSLLGAVIPGGSFVVARWLRRAE
jgi:integral membrane protein